MTDPILVYVAHPVSGDVAANLARARRWVRWILDTYTHIAPVANWITYCEVLDDDCAEHRNRSLLHDCALVERCDWLWLVGGRITDGMRAEAMAARMAGVEVWDRTDLGEEPPPR